MSASRYSGPLTGTCLNRRKLEDMAVRAPYRLKHLHFQPRHTAHRLGDARQSFQWQMAAPGIGRGSSGRIDLHERDLCAARFKFFEAQRVLLDLLRWRFLAVDGGEKALNNDRTLPGE